MNIKFKKAVDSGDLEGVRISLASEMMLDPRGESFNEMRRYAEKAFANLYEEHDGTMFDQNRENWTEKLLFSTRNALDENFSKERLDYYAAGAKVVLKDKADKMGTSNSKISGHCESNRVATSGTSGSSFKVDPLSVCVTVGGLLLGGTGLVLGKTILTVVGAVGATVGGCRIYKSYNVR